MNIPFMYQKRLTDINDSLLPGGRHSSRPVVPILAIIMLLLIGLLANRYLSNPEQKVDLRSKAETEAVVFSIYPADPSMPPNTSVSLTANAKTHTIGFLMVSFSFDPTKIHLASNIQLTDKFQNILMKSTPEEANASGNILIAMALFDPENNASPSAAPTGVFEVARMTFTPVSTAPGDYTDLVLVSSDTQVVAQDNPDIALPYMTTQVTFSLNPIPTPTLPAVTDSPVPPTPTEIPMTPSETPPEGTESGTPAQPTPTPTQPASTPTNTPVLSPTETPIPTREPSPTPELIIPPTPTQTPTDGDVAPTNSPTPTIRAREGREPTPTVPWKPTKAVYKPTPTIGFLAHKVRLSPTPISPATPISPTSSSNRWISADFNRNGCVGTDDAFTLLVNVLLFSKDTTYDLNSDGGVNILDFYSMMLYLGMGCGK